jgi:predicted extracellular nuclease
MGRNWWSGSLVFIAACANTTGGGGVAQDTVGGLVFDVAAGPDTNKTGGDVTSAGKDTATDSASPGTTMTAAKIQAGSSGDCAKIVDTLKGVSGSFVITSPLRTSTSKSGKTLEGVFVQDKGGGPGSGLYLSEDGGGPLASVKVGDSVSVTGDVAEFYCFTQLKPKVLAVDGTELPVAVTIDVASVGDKATDADNRKYESVFVSVEGVVVADPLVKGTDGKPHSILVGKTDGDLTLRIGSAFGHYMQGKSGTASYQKGQKLNVQGFLEFTFNQWQIAPVSVTVVP